MKTRLAAIVILVAAMVSAQETAVPVENEPHHKTVFKNDYVQAFRVNLEPGATSLMHTHSLDDGAVRLSTATVAADSPGQPIGPPEPVIPGMVSARDNAVKPHTHRVHNIGLTLFDVVDVQVLSRPAGAESAAISPPAAENAKMRLYRYELAPGATTGPHTHARPYLLVAATDAKLRTTFAGGSSKRRFMKAGEMEWVEKSSTHTFINRGRRKVILVEFELK
jgi:quercetin dioxygenase-like cupin family protein